MVNGTKTQGTRFFWLFVALYALLFNFVPAYVLLVLGGVDAVFSGGIGSLPLILSDGTIIRVLLFGAGFYSFVLFGYVVIRLGCCSCLRKIRIRRYVRYEYMEQSLLVLTQLIAIISLLGAGGEILIKSRLVCKFLSYQ